MRQQLLAAIMPKYTAPVAPVVQSSSTGSSGSSTTYTCTTPSGLQVGDLMAMFICTAVNVAVTDLGGWTEITGAVSTSWRAFWKISTGTTFGTGVTVASAVAYDAICLRINGHSASAPVDQVAWYGAQDLGLAPSLTPTPTDSLLISFFGCTSNTRFVTAVNNGMTVVNERHTNRSVAVYKKTLATNAATGNSTATFSPESGLRTGMHINFKS